MVRCSRSFRYSVDFGQDTGSQQTTASQAIKEKQTLEKSDQTRPQCQRAQREPCPMGVTLQAVHIFLMVSGNKQTQSCLFPG